MTSFMKWRFERSNKTFLWGEARTSFLLLGSGKPRNGVQWSYLVQLCIHMLNYKPLQHPKLHSPQCHSFLSGRLMSQPTFPKHVNLPLFHRVCAFGLPLVYIYIYIGSVSSVKPCKYHEPSTSRNAVKKSLAHDVSSFPRLHPLKQTMHSLKNTQPMRIRIKKHIVHSWCEFYIVLARNCGKQS